MNRWQIAMVQQTMMKDLILHMDVGHSGTSTVETTKLLQLEDTGIAMNVYFQFYCNWIVGF